MADHDLEVAVIGAGMSGLYIAHRLGERGVPFTILEKADEVGGTWRENVYPGLFVDVPTSKYQLAFAPKYDWSRPFAPGPEIRDYLRGVADDHDLRRHICFRTTVTEARWDDDGWRLATSEGRVIRAAVVIFATGFLHHPRLPSLPGMTEFAGASFHSSRWPRGLGVAGKRVGIVGSGSSGIQLVTELAYRDCQVTQFVRTPQWIETIDNPESSPEHRELAGRDPEAGRRLLAELEEGINQDPRLRDPYWKLLPGRLRDDAMQALREDLRAIRDPGLRAALTPDFPPGCKRIPKSPGYYQAVQEPNVRIARGGVERVDRRGVIDSNGEHHDLDVLVYATGFQAHAYMRPVRVLGEDGLPLDSVWADGPFSYRGVAVPGFPNMFLLHGPFSPVNNVPVPTTLDHEAGWICRVIDLIRADRVAVSPTTEATDRFRRVVTEAIPQTVWADGCDNWYKGRSGTAVIWPWYEREHEAMLDDLAIGDLASTPLRRTRAEDSAAASQATIR